MQVSSFFFISFTIIVYLFENITTWNSPRIRKNRRDITQSHRLYAVALKWKTFCASVTGFCDSDCASVNTTDVSFFNSPVSLNNSAIFRGFPLQTFNSSCLRSHIYYNFFCSKLKIRLFLFIRGIIDVLRCPSRTQYIMHKYNVCAYKINFPARARDFFYSTVSRPAVGPNQPPTQRVRGRLFLHE
jgi:hypothetical protein